MTKEEGAKPQTVIEFPKAATQVGPLDQEYTCYKDKLNGIITYLTTQKLSNAFIDGKGVVKLLDGNEDNTAIRTWLDDNGLLTKGAFDKALRKHVRDTIVYNALGFIPQSVQDFVKQYAEKQGITLTPNGMLKRQRAYKLINRHGKADDEVNHHNCDTSDVTRLVYDVANTEGADLVSFGRELRLVNDNLNLGYRDSVVTDAVDAWREQVTLDMKVELLLTLKYEKGRATGPAGQAMWADMEAACFDTSDTTAGFPTAVLKKFMWQVKRKARGLTVTNHLMPVLSGAQGKGKTHFVQAMTNPLEHFKRQVDFNIITDGKTADIWSSLILFIDEMGFFSKADVDTVKNVITAESRSIRAMRQNSSAPIRNHATLIGCTNKSLGQLIRDETGGRRFAELVWRNDPNWDALNQVDWVMLWQSVDEMGEDPLIAANMMERLREQQEDNRNQSPIEIWVREEGHVFKNWKRASELHSLYREWEKEAFPRQDTNQTMFGRSLTNLITSIEDFPFEKQQQRDGVKYRYSGI
ncbi:VapE domain-containing protein [Sphingobium sp. KCTC 72723]|uniref:VapE domain-containing protein n=1 Tax=Sphingobium sp. KCTC 72723 TaxID=2733867 RepID=UPI00165DFDA4|nr:VapE domain-containing protein [Sphingobium sp. KCTC 72723]